MTMQEQTTDTAVREKVHTMWASVAGRWAEYADQVEHRAVDLTGRMLATLQPGDRVLELACGPGGLGLAAAERVGPAGEVVLSDVAPEMVAIAAARAAERGLTNVRSRPLDIEAIDEPDSTYDVVLCREGLMFALDPSRAAGEIRRVLRPGGRASISVWGSPEENPWLSLVMRHASEVLGAPVPPPGVPGPFSLADPDRLAAALSGAGLAGVAVEAVPARLRAPSFEAWWTRTSALAGPLATILARLPEAKQAALVGGLRQAVAPYATPTGLDLPGLALLAHANRA